MNQPKNEAIVDSPIRVHCKAELPAVGVENQLYRCHSTKVYYRYLNGAYVELDSTRPVRWSPFELLFQPLMDILGKARACTWFWFDSSVDAKYINIRIDMRDGNCIITDNKGHVISIEDLAIQLPRKSSRPTR